MGTRKSMLDIPVLLCKHVASTFGDFCWLAGRGTLCTPWTQLSCIRLMKSGAGHYTTTPAFCS
jgi:hypothetical protein